VKAHDEAFFLKFVLTFKRFSVLDSTTSKPMNGSCVQALLAVNNLVFQCFILLCLSGMMCNDDA